jgi:hypothetical protein
MRESTRPRSQVTRHGIHGKGNEWHTRPGHVQQMAHSNMMVTGPLREDVLEYDRKNEDEDHTPRCTGSGRKRNTTQQRVTATQGAAEAHTEGGKHRDNDAD